MIPCRVVDLTGIAEITIMPTRPNLTICPTNDQHLCVVQSASVRSCGAVDSGYYCTRERGHDGQHCACAFDPDHNLHVWDAVPEPNKESLKRVDEERAS